MLIENPYALALDADFRRDQAQRDAARARTVRAAATVAARTRPRGRRAAFITRALGSPRLHIPGLGLTRLGRTPA